ncbi:MAG: sulfite exporter TauE/SafE family protein [Acutalibacteraceae bacterium]|jgi:sulfite exporter TauE/SafE/copper chaperone CopZ
MLSQTLKIDGMTCVNCQNRIERRLKSTTGVTNVLVSFTSGTANITYDENLINIEKIIEIIEELDYKVVKNTNQKTPKTDISKILGVSVILLALYMIFNRFGVLNIFNIFPEATKNTGYGMLFVIGLLTSLHCVAMCGGINLSQCVPQSVRAQNGEGRFAALYPSFLYNLGRVISYTVVGGIVGAIGSVVGFTGALKGIVQLVAGVFMVIMGLNMLGVFPFLRRLNPRMPKIFARKINEQKSGKGPLVVGLLNGLMPCGPLQAMQIYALSTGSPLKGALSMLLFSLGTVPLMFGLGALSTFLSRKFTRKMMTASALLVVILGVSMFGNGMTLSGISLKNIVGTKENDDNANIAKVSDNIQTVTTTLYPGSYEPITVKKGIPVKWIIKAEKGSVNGCNNEIFIPAFNIEKKLDIGDNVIEFTPNESGIFPYSCWMGMIKSSITVVDDTENGEVSTPAEQKSNYKIPVDTVAIAEIKDGKQTVSIDMVADRFTPAVIVMQKDLETVFNINGVEINENNKTLVFPKYYAQVEIKAGENNIYLYPGEDFDFTTLNNSFFGYVKVVEDINKIDIEKIKAQIGEFVPTIRNFEDIDALPACH